ncbi:MAG: FMN-binding protein, partial [Limnochordia bacterium]
MKKVLGIILSIMLVLSFATVVLAASVQDGTYVVETKGMYNGLKLSVTFTNGKITEVKVLEHQETAGISDLPIAKIPAEIVANNSVNIDTIAGATRTSAGILDG